MVNVGTCLRAILAYTLPWLLVCVHVATEPHPWHADDARSATGTDREDHPHSDHDAPNGGHSLADHAGSAVHKPGSARLPAVDPELADRVTETVPASAVPIPSAPRDVELRICSAQAAARCRGRSPPGA